MSDFHAEYQNDPHSVTDEERMPANCSSCQAPIIWAKTEAGRAMPLDAEPVDDGNMELLPDGICRFVPKGDHTTVVVPLYKSHFATCPHARTHRKAK